jgi:hypothetical protein
MNSHVHTIANGIIGTTSSFLAVSTTFLTQYELWVRAIGGTLFILVSLMSLYNLVKPKKEP